MTERHVREIIATPEEKRAEVIKHIEEQVKAHGKVPSINEIQEFSGRKSPKPESEVKTSGSSSECSPAAAGSLEELPLEHEVGSEAAFKEARNGIPARPSGSEPAHREEPEVIDIGEFLCTECNQVFHVEHVSDSVHRLRLVRQR